MIDITSLRSALASLFPAFGPNKSREVERLVFEIAKRENLPFQAVLDTIPPVKQFSLIKNYLICRRYPELSRRGIGVEDTFSAVSIAPHNAADLSGRIELAPKIVYVEKRAAGSALAKRMAHLFPAARFEIIDNYKSFSQVRQFGPLDYNRRLETFFLVREEHDFFKVCPCSNGVRSCGYHNANLGFGCPFECSYCFLQSYTNAPGIVFPVNLEDFFKAFASYRQDVRIGSGETTDSLAFDHITDFSLQLVEYFRSRPNTVFEFKTKSDNIHNLLAIKPASNVVLGWSLNPQSIVEREEFFTASLDARLEAARLCAEAGYRTAFHFDPIFYYPAWRDDYAAVVAMLFRRIPRDSIAWISLGTLRMTARHKKMIENRFPMNTILDAELVRAPDGKFRYHATVRKEIYKTMLDFLYAHGVTKSMFIYLCMEPASMYKEAGLRF